MTMFSAYVEIGVTRSSSRRQEQCAEDRQRAADERQQGSDAAAEDDAARARRGRETRAPRRGSGPAGPGRLTCDVPSRRAARRGSAAQTPDRTPPGPQPGASALPRRPLARTRRRAPHRGRGCRAVVRAAGRVGSDPTMRSTRRGGVASGRARARAAGARPTGPTLAPRLPGRAGFRCPARRSRSRRVRAAAASRDRTRRRGSRRRAHRAASCEACARRLLRTAR